MDEEPNINYSYKEKWIYPEGDMESGVFIELTDKELVECNNFFKNLHIHKIVRKGKEQRPFWVFAVTNHENGEVYRIRLTHLQACNPKEVYLTFSAVGYLLPDTFTRKRNAFLWEDFINYFCVECSKNAVMEA